MKKLDISHNDEIVLYSDFGVIGACRAYWMFLAYGKEVVCLNGTLNHWKNEGYKIEKGPL